MFQLACLFLCNLELTNNFITTNKMKLTLSLNTEQIKFLTEYTPHVWKNNDSYFKKM